MQGYFRLFPLGWVVFPEEILHLHIFEPRYIQLVNECLETGEPFGIPFFDQENSNFGTLVEIREVRKTYPDGTSDIIVKGLQLFELLKFDRSVEGKTYPGGKIKTKESTYSYDPKIATRLLNQIHQFFKLIGSKPDIKDENPEKLSFIFGHKLGLNPRQELQLVLLSDESERQEFLLKYLEKTIPGIQNIELAKTRIKQNGHFKSFDALKF